MRFPTRSSIPLSALAPATRYHARTVAANATDTVYGGEQTFTTGVAGRTVSVASAHYLLSSPVSGTVLASLLDPLWTQGMANADYAGGSPNVWTWDGSNWDPVQDLAAETLAAGQGVLVYVFGDTNFDGVADLPVEVSVTGSEGVSDVQIPTFHSADATREEGVLSGWNLVGNPFSYPIDTDRMGLGSEANPGYDPVLFTYNPDSLDWESWNGQVGTLLGGEIPPYTGFLVRTTSEASPPLSIPASARALDSQAKAIASDVAQARSLALRLTLEDPLAGISDDMFFQFTSAGRFASDPLVAPKLQSPALTDRLLAASYAPAASSLERSGKLAHEIQHLPRPGVGETDAAYTLPLSLLWLETAKWAGKALNRSRSQPLGPAMEPDRSTRASRRTSPFRRRGWAGKIPKGRVCARPCWTVRLGRGSSCPDPAAERFGPRLESR